MWLALIGRGERMAAWVKQNNKTTIGFKIWMGVKILLDCLM